MDLAAVCVISMYVLVLGGSLASGADIPCDLDGKNSTCPDGFCCVRDEYFFSITNCKKIGQEGDPCVTTPSFFECPCAQNHYCKSNVQGHITSHFGTCHLQSGVALVKATEGYGTFTTEDTDKGTSMLMKALTTQRDRPDPNKVVEHEFNAVYKPICPDFAVMQDNFRNVFQIRFQVNVWTMAPALPTSFCNLIKKERANIKTQLVCQVV